MRARPPLSRAHARPPPANTLGCHPPQRAVLDFGVVPLGASKTLRLELENGTDAHQARARAQRAVPRAPRFKAARQAALHARHC